MKDIKNINWDTFTVTREELESDWTKEERDELQKALSIFFQKILVEEENLINLQSMVSHLEAIQKIESGE
jgi:hypothetical protein